jgi:hypothetical protein
MGMNMKTFTVCLTLAALVAGCAFPKPYVDYSNADAATVAAATEVSGSAKYDKTKSVSSPVLVLFDGREDGGMALRKVVMVALDAEQSAVMLGLSIEYGGTWHYYDGITLPGANKIPAMGHPERSVETCYSRNQCYFVESFGVLVPRVLFIPGRDFEFRIDGKGYSHEARIPAAFIAGFFSVADKRGQGSPHAE